MELYSDTFQDLVRLYVNSSNLFLGTLSKVHQHPLIHELKGRDDVTIFDLTPDNREERFKKIRALAI